MESGRYDSDGSALELVIAEQSHRLPGYTFRNNSPNKQSTWAHIWMANSGREYRLEALSHWHPLLNQRTRHGLILASLNPLLSIESLIDNM